MSPVTATALRRAAIASGALGATLTGHMLTLDGWRLLPVAPLLWLGIIALTIPTAAPWRGLAAFSAWRPAKVLVALVGAQAAFHLLVDAAPWAVGLVMDHQHGPVIAPRAVLVHLAIALVLWVALCFGQRLLVRAVAVARALLSPAPGRAGGRGPGRILRDVAAVPSRWRHRARTSRGPPAGLLRPLGAGPTLVMRP